MAEWAPVTEVAEVWWLDGSEIVAGFQHGAAGNPEPGSWASRSFWHGWRNGRVSAGLAPSDSTQDALLYRWLVLTGYSEDSGMPVQ